jgi:UDP-N-acetylmuramate dehydrogenase
VTRQPPTDPLDELAAALAQYASVVRHAPSAPLTTYRVGGPIDTLVSIDSFDQLLGVSGLLSDQSVPVAVIGRGSNLLVLDGGFRGVALRLGAAFETVDAAVDGTVDAGGATPLPVLARQSANLGLRGLEFFVGIPGTVGGAVRMNAGGHGRETIEVLVEATILRLGESDTFTRGAAELGLAFRSSALDDRDLVVRARFAATPGDLDEARAEIDEVVRWRREHQPGGQNCGSVFVNPPGDAAGRLVELAGLKQHRVGGAFVSDKHANFIQADATASAQDIVRLIAEVHERVLEVTGVHLRTELRVIGDPPESATELRT